jgi:hypothetical protein
MVGKLYVAVVQSVLDYYTDQSHAGWVLSGKNGTDAGMSESTIGAQGKVNDETADYIHPAQTIPRSAMRPAPKCFFHTVACSTRLGIKIHFKD